MNDDLQDLFQQPPEEPMHVNIDQLKSKSSDFERSIRWRNRIELTASALVIAAFSYQLVIASSWGDRIGPALLILGTLMVAHRFLTAGSHLVADPTAPAGEFVEQHRRELLYQADLLSAVPKWYIGPFVPGFAWFIGSALVTSWGTPGFPVAAGVGALLVVVMAGLAGINHRGAATLRRKAGAL